MNEHEDETVDSEARYKGFEIILSSIGNFFVFVYNVVYLRKSLSEATKLIDELHKSQNN